MSACNCCSEPNAFVTDQVWDAVRGDSTNASPSTAFTAALAATPAFDISNFGGEIEVENSLTFGGATWAAIARKIKYRWRFYSATCYLHIWWDERLREFQNGVQISEVFTPKEYEIQIAGIANGLCIPAGPLETNPPFANPDDSQKDLPSGLCLGDTFLFTPVMPTVQLSPTAGDVANSIMRVVNVRWSFIPSYTPPTDGSANGFPI